MAPFYFGAKLLLLPVGLTRKESDFIMHDKNTQKQQELKGKELIRGGTQFNHPTTVGEGRVKFSGGVLEPEPVETRFERLCHVSTEG